MRSTRGTGQADARRSATTGSVDLLRGPRPRCRQPLCLSTTPGAIYKDLLILGHARLGGTRPCGAGAHPRLRRAHRQASAGPSTRSRSRASPATTPGRTDAWTRVGGANAWSGIGVDEERGLVFLPTGSAAFDFWGGNRLGANLFANCLLALDGRHGQAGVALPVRPSRHLGPRSARAAGAGDGARATGRRSTPWRR